jgi:hypothetical protein
VIRALWIVWALTVALVIYIFAFADIEDADAKPVKWNYAGASVFGGACEGGVLGYRGDFLPSLPHTFAELGMGNMLGLPYKAKVRFLHKGRKVTGVKRDIGGGGGHVKGKPRIFDFWEPLLTKLLGKRDCNWTGVVAYRRL